MRFGGKVEGNDQPRSVGSCVKSDRELMAQAFHDGKIGAWWRDRNGCCFCAELPGNVIGRISVARAEEILARLPAGRMKPGARGSRRQERYVDL